jgi:hypothetical protein
MKQLNICKTMKTIKNRTFIIKKIGWIIFIITAIIKMVEKFRVGNTIWVSALNLNCSGT